MHFISCKKHLVCVIYAIYEIDTLCKKLYINLQYIIDDACSTQASSAVAHAPASHALLYAFLITQHSFALMHSSNAAWLTRLPSVGAQYIY